jgi:HEAT repeat protein
VLAELIDKLHHSKDEVERSEIAERLGNYEGEQVILALINALADEEETVQGAAMSSLRRIRPDPRPYLYRALLDTEEVVRWGITELLEDFPSPETENILQKALNDESPNVRGAAARSFRSIATTNETSDALVRLLNDHHSFPRYEALRTLRQIAPGLASEGTVIWQDLSSSDPNDRVAALNYIRAENKEEWVEEVRKLFDDPDLKVRRAASRALEHLSR